MASFSSGWAGAAPVKAHELPKKQPTKDKRGASGQSNKTTKYGSTTDSGAEGSYG